MAPLTAFAAGLRASGAVPDFDPLDGGTRAEALFLLEKPGPTTLAGSGAGSGIVSRDNDTATAEAILRFMQMAGLARERTVLWNAAPWWNGSMTVTAAELRRGLACLPGLLALLPGLRAVVLVGRSAGHARQVLPPGLAVFASAHPSLQVRAAFPDRWRAIGAEWTRARDFLDGLHLAGAGP